MIETRPELALAPLEGRVIVRQDEVSEQVTESGVVAALAANRERPNSGMVIAANGVPVIYGDKVIFSKYAGHEISLNGEVLLVLRESDILTKVLE